jgi:hypothetical protein
LSEIAETEMPVILEALGGVVGDLATSIETVDGTIQALYQLSAGLIDLTEAVPNTDSAEELQVSLTGLADEVRLLAVDLGQISETTAPVSEDTITVSRDLDAISDNLQGFEPIIDQYIDLVGDARAGIEATRDNLPRIARTVNLVIIVLAVWLSALHLAPMVEGWELILRRRESEAARQRPSGAVIEPEGDSVVSMEGEDLEPAVSEVPPDAST